MDYEELLHQRIKDSCLKLIGIEDYPAAAHKAVKIVELALKERTGNKKLYGQLLIKKSFGGKKPLLKVPLGEQLQDDAQKYFNGCNAYYRNYAAHDGENFDKKMTLRLLIIASDLLDLLSASSLSYEGIGGIEGLVKNCFFESKEQLRNLLVFINGSSIMVSDPNDFYESLYGQGFEEKHIEILIDFGFIEGTYESVIDSDDNIEMFFIELTDLGDRVLREISEE